MTDTAAEVYSYKQRGFNLVSKREGIKTNRLMRGSLKTEMARGEIRETMKNFVEKISLELLFFFGEERVEDSERVEAERCRKKTIV